MMILQKQVKEIKELFIQNNNHNIEKVNNHDRVLKDMHESVLKIGSRIKMNL